MSIAVGGGNVYLSTTAGVYEVPAVLGGRTRLASEQTYSTAYANVVVYALMESAVYEIRDDGTRIPVLTFPIAGDNTNARHVAIDGTELYASWPPHLFHIDLRSAGGFPNTLVDNTGRYAGAMVAADGHAYWGTLFFADTGGVGGHGGGVMRVAAPCR
jgi:hypothetical protein